MANILSISSIVFFVLTVVFLILSGIIWKKYNIPEVYGDLSGKTVRRSLEHMYEEKNKKTKKKTVSSKESKKEVIPPVPAVKEQQKEEIPAVTQPTEAITGLVEGNLKQEEEIPETTYLYDQETALLQNKDETQLLVNNHGFRILSQVMIVHTNETID